MKKVYSAFISSAFASLQDERKLVIDVLLDFRILPISMEHFTVSTSGEFSDLQDLIDDSDFFIMLMGSRYGSCDKDGVSWTEKEYRYARAKDKPTIVLICDELASLLDVDEATLTEDQRKQVQFCKSISFARKIDSQFDIKTILLQFFHTYPFTKCIGWTRIDNLELDEKRLQEWRDSHRVFDLSGNWYHVHLSDDDDTYIRVGTLKVEQVFTPALFTQLHIDGYNHNVEYYDAANGVLHENETKKTNFVGEYTLKENGEIFGIFRSRRSFKSEFNSFEVRKGTHRGIHDFWLDVGDTHAQTTRLEGEFHDEAPSPKQGQIFVFRSEQDRNAFLLRHREHIIEKRG